MIDTQLLNRIAVDPEVMGGKPVIRGTRLPVEFICRQIAHGATVAELLQEYDGLVAEDEVAAPLAVEALVEAEVEGVDDVLGR